MKFVEIHIGYRVSFDKLEQVVYAKLDKKPPEWEHIYSVPDDDCWVMLVPTNGPTTSENLAAFQHIYPAPEEAIKAKIARELEDARQIQERVARLSAALAQESEASGG